VTSVFMTLDCTWNNARVRGAKRNFQDVEL
jgi:hypothetical protein